MKKILIAGCNQEISSFNPVTCDYDFFQIYREEGIREFNTGLNSYIGGAIDELENIDNFEPIFTYYAEGSAAGPLEQSSFLRISEEYFHSIKKYAGKIDGVYLSLHGSMGTTEELDPEGFILEETRKILGESVPIVISLDLHGVLTSKMLDHCNGVTSLHTYPHVDFADTGKRAIKMLTRIINDGVNPVCARIKIPALVRGTELVTEKGIFGEQIRYAKSLHSNEKILSAGFLICNPFTDVPELCSQSYVYTDNDRELASEAALYMANTFWPNRSKMQGKFISTEDAVKQAASMKGPIAFTDAADAPSSGAQGDSNAIISEMVKQNFPHSVLASIVDPNAAKVAHEKGVGSFINIPVGGALEKRFAPLELIWKVISLSNEQFMPEKWAFLLDPGLTAVIKSDNITLVVVSKPIMQIDRSIYIRNDGSGDGDPLNPKDFHVTIVKSPHCEPEFYDDWVEENFNVDAPGSTSANLPTLGHKHCVRPMYPMEQNTKFNPEIEFYSR